VPHDFRDADAGSMLRVKGSDTLCLLGAGLVTCSAPTGEACAWTGTWKEEARIRTATSTIVGGGDAPKDARPGW
jgi:hypothetical protein